MMEWVKYSSYGVPIGLPAGDTDSDGDCDQSDINNIDNWVSGYDVRYDLDLDGDIDATDSSRASSTFQGTTLGPNVLSSSSVGNRKGYSGYEWDEAVSKYHVRNRILDPALGRWTRRDPLGYVDGMSLYEYVGSDPQIRNDQFGLSRGCGVYLSHHPHDAKYIPYDEFTGAESHWELVVDGNTDLDSFWDNDNGFYGIGVVEVKAFNNHIGYNYGIGLSEDPNWPHYKVFNRDHPSKPDSFNFYCDENCNIQVEEFSITKGQWITRTGTGSLLAKYNPPGWTGTIYASGVMEYKFVKTDDKTIEVVGTLKIVFSDTPYSWNLGITGEGFIGDPKKGGGKLGFTIENGWVVDSPDKRLNINSKKWVYKCSDGG